MQRNTSSSWPIKPARKTARSRRQTRRNLENLEAIPAADLYLVELGILPQRALQTARRNLGLIELILIHIVATLVTVQLINVPHTPLLLAIVWGASLTTTLLIRAMFTTRKEPPRMAL